MNELGDTPTPTNESLQLPDESNASPSVQVSPISGAPSAPSSQEAPAEAVTDPNTVAPVSTEPPTPPERKFKPKDVDLSFKGLGDTSKIVPQKVVDNLRRYRNSPAIIEAFDAEYGAGSAARHLNLPTREIMDNLYANRDNPAVVKEYDNLFGGMSKEIIEIFDPATDPKRREELQQTVLKTLLHGPKDTVDPKSFKYDPTFVEAARYLYNLSQQSFDADLERLRQQAADPSDPYAQKVAADALKRKERTVLTTDEQIADWGLRNMAFVHNNLPRLGVEALRMWSDQASQEEKDAFLYLFQQTDPSNLNYSMEGTARAAAAMATDPAVWANIGTLGLTSLLRKGTQNLTKEGMILALKKGAEVGLQAGVNTAAYASVQDALKQAVEIGGGAADEFSFGRTAKAGAVGGVTGFTLGTLLGTAGSRLSQWLTERVEKARAAFQAETKVPLTEKSTALEKAAPELPPISPREVSPKLFEKVDELDAKIAQQTERIAKIDEEITALGGAENRAAPIVDDQIAAIEKQLEQYQGKKANSSAARKLQQRLEDLKNTPEYLRARQIDDLIREQEATRISVTEAQAERAALGPKVNRVTTEAERLTAARARKANEPTTEEANRMTPEERVRNVIDETTPTAREWNRHTKAPSKPLTEVPEAVTEVLNRVDDLSPMNWQQVRQAIAPVIDDWLQVASSKADDLFRIFEASQPALDLTKLQGLMTTAVSKVERAIEDTKLSYDAALKLAVTDAKQIDALKAQIADLTRQYGELQKVDIPLGRYSGRLLAMRQIEDRINAALRVDVAKLKAQGASSEDIAKAVVDARRKLNLQRLDNLMARHEQLVKQLEKAENIERRAEIETKIDEAAKSIEQEVKALSEHGVDLAKEQTNAALKVTKQIVKDVIGVGINFMLSGLGTIKRAAGGSVIHNAYMKAELFAGKVLDPIYQGIKKGEIADIPLKVSEGVKMYRLLRDGRYYGLRSGSEGLIQTWADALVEGGKNAWAHTTKSGVSGQGEGVFGIRGANYGLTGTAEKAVDKLGTILDLPTIGLRMTDETIGNLFNKSGAGEYASLQFYERLTQSIEEVTAKLRDPNLSALERDGLKAELASLKGKNPKIDIDGTVTDLKGYVEKYVASSFDESGRFINQQVIDRTNYILMRKELEGVWSGLERWANDNWWSKVMLPFLRSPLQGAQRGAEQVPFVQMIPGISNLHTELKSADPLIAARARGKYYTGVVTVLTLWKLAEQGYLPEPTQWWNKQEMDARLASNKDLGGFIPLNASVPVLGNTVDTTGLDPISFPITFVSFLYHGLKDYDRRVAYNKEVQGLARQDGYNIGLDESDDIFRRGGEALKLVAAGTAVAFMNNPTFTFAQDIVSLINAVSKSSDPNDVLKDNTAAQKILTKMLRSQIGKYSPAIFKGVRDMNDPKLYDTSVLDTSSMWSTLSDIIKAEFSWYRDDLSLRYDFMGEPIDRKYTPRSIAGPLTEKTATSSNPRVVAVRDAAYELAKYNLDRHYLTFSERVPDKFLNEMGVDPRAVKAVSGDRRVLDLFAKNLRKTGLLNSMYEALVDKDFKAELANRGYTAGGPAKSEYVDKIRRMVTLARAEAWRRTLIQEGLMPDGSNVEPTGNIPLFNKRKEGEYRIRRDVNTSYDTFLR